MGFTRRTKAPSIFAGAAFPGGAESALLAAPRSTSPANRSRRAPINIDPATGVLIGKAAGNLSGSFDNDTDGNIFKANFGGNFGSLSFCNVARPGLDEVFLLGDLSVIGSLQGGGSLGEVDLIYLPEPASLALVVFGLMTVLVRPRMAARTHGFVRSMCHLISK